MAAGEGGGSALPTSFRPPPIDGREKLVNGNKNPQKPTNKNTKKRKYKSHIYF